MKTKRTSVNGLAMAIGILAVTAGILILVWPDLVRWLIGFALIGWGVLTLVDRR